MTISVSNIVTTSDTFGQWVIKTNQLADALSTKVVTTDSNTTTGDAAISGRFTASTLYANTIAGFSGAAVKNLVAISNVTFAANANFEGIRVNLGLGSNVSINTGNTTHRILVVNTAASNTLVATKITFADIANTAFTTPANNSIITYNAFTQNWVNSTNAILTSLTSNTLSVTNSAVIASALFVNTSLVNLTTSINAVSFITSTTTSNTAGVFPASNTTGSTLGSNEKRWNIYASNADISGSLTANNVVINGSLSGSGMALSSLIVTTNNVTLGSSFYLVANGNVGLATNTPANKLQVNGTGRVESLGVGTNASGTVGEIRASNDITAFYSSDKNLKSNIKNITDALAKVKAINGVEFDWTDEYINNRGGEDGYFTRKHDVGVIAQEIQQVIPEVVGARDDGTLAVKYDRLVALLIEAVKELSEQVEQLKK